MIYISFSSFVFGALYFGRPSCIYMGCTDIGYLYI